MRHTAATEDADWKGTDLRLWVSYRTVLKKRNACMWYGVYALSNLNKHFPSTAESGEMQLLLREDMINLRQNKCYSIVLCRPLSKSVYPSIHRRSFVLPICSLHSH